MNPLQIHESEYSVIIIKELLQIMSEAGISQRKLCRRMGWSRGHWCRLKRKGQIELHKKDVENLQLFIKGS